MRYLFFDIECANSLLVKSKICSLGYVITDENFNELEGKDILINPDGPFLINDIPDFSLKYPEEEFRKYPKFTERYQEIKKLFSGDDLLIFGHSVFNDCQYLNDEILYWGLDSINYTCYDTQIMYMRYHGIKDQKSLESVAEELTPLHQADAHDSLSDARLTMLVAKGMCSKLNCSLIDFAKKIEDSKIEVKDYKIYKEMSQSFNSKKHLKFLHNVHPLHEAKKSLKNEGVAISLNYETKHYRELCKIVQRVTDMGGKYVFDMNNATLFVKYTVLDDKNKEKYDARYRYITKLNETGKNIKIITFEEFLNLIELSEDSLIDIDTETLDCYFNGKNLVEKRREKRIKEIKEMKKIKKDDIASNTLGDRFSDFFSSLSLKK